MRGNQGTAGPVITNNAQNNRLIAAEKNLADAAAAGAQDTIYLCNFRVSVDGDWLCLKELADIEEGSAAKKAAGGTEIDGCCGDYSGGGNTHDQYDVKCDEKIVERDWVNYYCRCFLGIIFHLNLFLRISFFLLKI